MNVVTIRVPNAPLKFKITESTCVSSVLTSELILLMILPTGFDSKKDRGDVSNPVTAWS
jgi:hypothetical protein